MRKRIKKLQIIWIEFIYKKDYCNIKINMKKYLILGLIIIFVGSFVIPSTGIYIEKSSTILIQGNTLYVGGSGPGNYTNIQDAIDDANNGDTIFIYNDSSPYYENIAVDKTITLTGEDKNSTIIDGGGIDSVIEVYGDNVKIEGFTIKNCQHDLSEAGINILSESNIIKNNKFLNNQCSGIRLSDSDLNLIENNFFKDNIGYHIFLQSKSNNNTIQNNYLTESDDYVKICNGIWLSHSSYNIVYNNEITELKFPVGISLYDRSCYNLVKKNIIYNNPSDTSGASIQIDVHSDFNIVSDNEIRYNNGAGIEMFFSQGNEIIGNTIDSVQYQGITLTDCRYDNIIKYNNITSNDEGIYIGVYSSKNTVESNNLINNTYGILMRGTDLLNFNPNNKIIKNNFIENGYGVYISVSDLYGPSNDNLIYYNNFINNTQNAFDECSNSWNKSGFGNYWDNYNGTDDNDDGIGDSSHSIPDNGSQDMYPLMESFGMTDLKINTKTSLFKLSAEVENIGNRNAFNVQWNITIAGGIIGDRESSDTISIIHRPPHPVTNALIEERLMGLGKMTITIEAIADNSLLVTKTIPIFLLLFFIIPI